MDANIRVLDKMIIYKNAGIKFLRGGATHLLKASKGTVFCG